MNVTTLGALAAFTGLGAGIWLLVVAIVRPPRPRTPGARRRVPQRVPAALAVSLLVAMLTRWPVAALAAALLVWWWPALFGGGAAAQASLERLEALATWTENLKDTIAGAIGLEEAIPATTHGAAPAIRPALERLVERLRARQPLPAALRALAGDLDDPSADVIVAALVLNAGLRGPGLHATLEALVVSTRDELDLRRRTETGRRTLRTGVRIIAGVTVGFVAALTLFDSAYLHPYSSPTGQVALAAVGGIFAAAFAWLRALAREAIPPRLLTAAANPGVGR